MIPTTALSIPCLGPKTGATHYHTHLGLPEKGRAIKEMDICSSNHAKSKICSKMHQTLSLLFHTLSISHSHSHSLSLSISPSLSLSLNLYFSLLCFFVVMHDNFPICKSNYTNRAWQYTYNNCIGSITTI